MKISKLTKNAIKNTTVKLPSGNVKPAQKAVAAKASKAVVVKTKKSKKAPIEVKITGTSLALMTGKRSAGNGGALRMVQTGTLDGLPVIRATQQNNGLTVKDAAWCPIIGGCLRGTRQAQLELGGYVNGGKYGGKSVKVQLLTPAQWGKLSKPAEIKWNVDKAAIKGRALGDTAQSGLIAVEASGHYWQVETDSWKENIHERGAVKFIGK